MRDRASFPSNWISASIKDIVDPSRPITYGIVQPGPRFDRDHGTPIIRGQDYSSGTVKVDDLYCVDPRLATSFSRASVQGGDLLISIVGYVGTVAEVPRELAGANLTQTTARIAVREDLKGRYFLHFLRSCYFKDEVSRFTKGSAQPGLNLADVEVMRVSYPLDAAERATIAEILNTLDTTIRQTEAIIEKLKQVKQGLLHDLLTRGIDANGELRPPQSEAPHLYKVSPLGWIPNEWVIKRLDEYCVSVADGTHDSPKPADVGYPLITSKNLKGGRLDLTGSYLISDADYRAVRSRSSVEAGDILFGMIGTVGSPVVIEPGQDQIATKNVGLLRVGGNFLRGRFLKHWLESAATDRQLSEAMSGSTQRFIGLGTLRSLLTVEPSAQELSEVVAAAGKFSARIEHEDRELRKLILLKSGLMDDLLTGRVRVTPLLAKQAA